MGKFDIYKIDLKNLPQGVHTYEYQLGNIFFQHIDGDEVQKGKVQVALTLKRTSVAFEMDFVLNGTVVVPCDRCLDDMELPVETTSRLVVKLGETYAEESDEIVVIPEEEGAINLAWFLYEFVALAIPMKHVHAPGKCNKGMSSKLKKHSAGSSEDDEDGDDTVGGDSSMDEGSVDATDPRWDALKGLLDD
ncbi:DUF177 domain-containing protein [Parabacteroides sp. OttesenSCG-928-K15]|nr:DUF177 domain-containing protein [Parabacteroides sp. OttesenSCG-928-K15]